MPSLGADMEQGTIVEWLVGPGDQVHRGDIVAVVATEKSDLDVEIFDDGVIDQLVIPVGQTVAVGTVLATVTVGPAEPVGAGAVATERTAVAAVPVAVATTVEHPRPTVLSPMIRHLADQLHVDLSEVQPKVPSGRVHREDVERAAARLPTAEPATRDRSTAHGRGRHLASPRARRLAAQRGVDLTDVVGTGPGATVVGADVLDRPLHPSEPITQGEPGRQLSRRRAIGDLMTRSWQTVPQYHLRHRISVEHALDWLDEHNAVAPVEERVLPAALLLRAVALAAASCDDVNGSWADGRFERSAQVHLGVAVALRTGGLLTPSIRSADRLSLLQLMAELRQLVTRARTGRLRASDTTDATITVTNLGDVGVDEVTGVIFPPQVAIVGFGAIQREAWVAEDSVGVHRVVHATLAADHRVSDGRIGARFLATIDRLLQEPEQL